MECLKAPRSCVPDYPANGPIFLSGSGAEAQANGYKQVLVHADAESFVYVAGPVTPGQTGIRTFCIDARGLVCAAPSLAEAATGSQCSPACEFLR